MNKYIVTVCCVIASFLANEVDAQQISGSVIDCSTIPFKAQRTTPFVAEHDETSETNRLPARFKVAKNDATYNTNTKMTWNDASQACKQYSEVSGGTDRGTWRLPTQREVGVLTLLRGNFNPQFVLPFNTTETYNEYYWCSTQAVYPPGYHWAVCYAVNGIVGNFDNGSLYRVRCVKDN